MFTLNRKITEEITKNIKRGDIIILPTDTIYGIVCSALNKESVEKLYKIRKRNIEKPMILLISSIRDLKIFGIKQKLPFKEWPKKTSIILECKNKKFWYLHRGKNSLAFRIPNNPSLIKLLKKTGPIVAPSANLEGKKPSETIEEAKAYFKDNVDMYIDVKRLKSKPSKIIRIKENSIEVVRK